MQHPLGGRKYYVAISELLHGSISTSYKDSQNFKSHLQPSFCKTTFRGVINEMPPLTVLASLLNVLDSSYPLYDTIFTYLFYPHNNQTKQYVSTIISWNFGVSLH